MKNPLIKGAATLARMANDGQLKLVDNLIGQVESLDFSKLANLTIKKKKQITDAKKVSKDIRAVTKKLHDEKQKVSNLISVYESLILMLDEFVIVTSIESEEKAFLTAPVYQTPTEFVKDYLLPKKKYNTLNDKIKNYQTIKKQYLQYIQKLKSSETDIKSAIKTQNQTANKMELLNNSIDKIKE